MSAKSNLGDVLIDEEHKSSVLYLFNVGFRDDVVLTTQGAAYAKSRSALLVNLLVAANAAAIFMRHSERKWRDHGNITPIRSNRAECVS